MAAPDVVNTWVPSTVSVNVTGPGAPPVEALMPTVTVPWTVAASSGLVKKAVSSPYGESTTTLRSAAALRPAPSVTTSERTCWPPASAVVSHWYEALVAVPDVVKRWMPSIVSVNVIGVPLAPVSAMPIVTTPVTLAPSAGLVNDAVSGGGSVTVTLRVAVAVRPAPSRTVRPRVCGPLGTLLAFQLNDAVAAVPEVVKTCVPSTVSVKTIGVPLAPVSDIPTVTLPNTVAPSAGLVNDATSGGGPPAMTTVRLALPVLFVESRTLTVAVCVPPEAPVLFHGIEIGPLAVVAVVATAVPSMLSVRFRVPAAAFSSQIVNQTVPLTVVPSVPGWVMKTLIVPGEPTVTLRVAVAGRPPPSCTVSCS